ncbi:MAG: hypothetical protein DYG94_07125 [Leptolyngbya sp. PLA3]|nr:MAG: hypothetical protein EDM82_06860 [Cyanobacteria bacterium CYA]MCE7968500.1 hypothetical protein [Leptolyngbya sp. PL-A3]
MMDKSELARALRKLAERFRRVAQSSATDDAANAELGALNEQGGRLYCAGGVFGLTDWPALEPDVAKWQPPFEPTNPAHLAQLGGLYQDVWVNVLLLTARTNPARIAGGYAAGGGIYELAHYDDDVGALGRWTFPPERWRQWAGDSAELADLLAERIEADASKTDEAATRGADDSAYRPATWFPKGMAARLRMAARKDRKTKRVATRTIDGVVCYLVSDARRWWPEDVPHEPKKA